MRESQLPLHYTSAEEQVRPACNYLADDLPNSVQITLAKRVIKPRSDKAMCWLLALAVISVTMLYIFNPKWVPSFIVAQTLNFSKQLLVPGVRPAAQVSLSDVERSAARHYGSSGGAHRTLASDRAETGTRDFMNQGSKAKTSQSKRLFLVPPPPPTPCALPPEFGSFPMQPAQQYAAPQQQLQQAQAQDSPLTRNQAAAGQNAPQQSDQELQAADQELEAALRSSLLTAGEWKR